MFSLVNSFLLVQQFGVNFLIDGGKRFVGRFALNLLQDNLIEEYDNECAIYFILNATNKRCLTLLFLVINTKSYQIRQISPYKSKHI